MSTDDGNFDALAVYNDLTGVDRKIVHCRKGKLIHILGEPPSRTDDLNEPFLSQFDRVVNCHPSCKHPGLHPWHQALPWWVGLRRVGPTAFECRMGYDELSAMRSIDKTREISIVCSNLNITPEHRKRVRFVKTLTEHFGERLHIYGNGFNPIEDKWDAIAPYKYHIVLENSVVPNYWTEKLADAFLGGALPIYHGCPNVQNYFASESLVRINIGRAEEAINIIENTMLERQYEQARDAIWSARRRVLDEHNLFAMLSRMFDEMPSGVAEDINLFPSRFYKPTVRSRVMHVRRLAVEAVARACFRRNLR